MGFVEDRGKKFDSYSQEAAKHVGPAGAEAWEHAEKFGQEAGKRLAPVAAEAWDQIGKTSKDAGVDIGATAEGAFRYADAFARQAAEHAAPVASEAFQSLTALAPDAVAQVKDSDWQFIGNFGQEVGKHVGVTADDVWGAIMSGDLVQQVQKQSATFIDMAQEHMPGMRDRVLAWIMLHPKEAAAIIACILVAPVTIAVSPAILGLVGFTSNGIAAGSLAASMHAGIGNVAAGSAFAILMSAGHGGLGLTVINAIAASSAMAGTCSTAAVSFIEAMKKDDCDREKEV